MELAFMFEYIPTFGYFAVVHKNSKFVMLTQGSRRYTWRWWSTYFWGM